MLLGGTGGGTLFANLFLVLMDILFVPESLILNPKGDQGLAIPGGQRFVKGVIATIRALCTDFMGEGGRTSPGTVVDSWVWML